MASHVPADADVLLNDTGVMYKHSKKHVEEACHVFCVIFLKWFSRLFVVESEVRRHSDMGSSKLSYKLYPRG